MSSSPLNSREIEASYQICKSIAKREARNFYFSFLTLPPAKRNAMCAIYAWMRRLDDLADDAPSPAEAAIAVGAWKRSTHEQFETGCAASSNGSENIWPALVDTVNRYKIPHHYFDEIIEGALMDQTVHRYETFDELYQYCYRVASVVGLVCLRVFEFSDQEAEKNGEWLGIAFQLTNILRDVREDAERGRVYLPLADLKKHGISEEEILKCQWSPKLESYFMHFADEIENYYKKAFPITTFVPKESQATLKIMTEIYHGILVEIKKLNYRVFSKRARVPTWKKLTIVAKHQLGFGC